MVIRMWKSATLVLIVLAVLSCATPEQRQSATPEQRKKRIAADQERIAAQIQRDLAPVCTSAGLIPGTDAHSHCILSLYRQELKRRAATAASPNPERP